MATTKALLIIAGLVLITKHGNDLVVMIPSQADVERPSGQPIPDHKAVLRLVGKNGDIKDLDPSGDLVARAYGAGYPTLVLPKSCPLISAVANPNDFDPESTIRADCLDENGDCRRLLGKRRAWTRIRVRGPWRLVPWANGKDYQQLELDLEGRVLGALMKQPGGHELFRSPMPGAFVLLADEGASLSGKIDGNEVQWERIELSSQPPIKKYLTDDYDAYCGTVWGDDPTEIQLAYLKSSASTTVHTAEDWHQMLFGRLLEKGRVLIPVDLSKPATLLPAGPVIEPWLIDILTDPDRPWRCPARLVSKLPDAWTPPAQ